MKNWFKEQAKKEVESARRLGKWYLRFARVWLIFLASLLGVCSLFTPAWPVGILLILIVIYLWKR